MIESLRIRNLAVVEEAVVDFAGGLNVLTGETGAGKSLILGALALLSGARASGEAVRSGASSASVEAILALDALPDLETDLVERGALVEEHRLVVSRTLAASGSDARSRAEIGGQWVPVAALRELFEGRLEISSQHASQALRHGAEHVDFLDDFGGLQKLSEKVHESYQGLRRDRQLLQSLRASEAERERQRDFLQFQCEEIDRVALQSGEIAALGEEQKRLAHAEELGSGLLAASEALAGGEGESANPRGGALASIERALAFAEPLLRFDPGLAESLERLRGAREEAADLGLDFARAADRTEVDPARLEQVEERIAQVERLRSKYGVDETAILSHREGLQNELRGLGADAGRAETLEKNCSDRAERLGKLAKTLSAKRRRAAAALAKEVDAALARLEMDGARFSVALPEATSSPSEASEALEGMPCGPRGAEHVEFRLASNPGEPPRPLAKVASGGELSRVFLALKNARLRGSDGDGRILVFDEVDTGIGGRAIDQVGLLLRELAERHQVLCITHWPQIAATASAHHRVSKRRRAGRTHTAVEALGKKARVDELARMAGGARVSEATRGHARDLLRKRGTGTSGARATPKPPGA